MVPELVALPVLAFVLTTLVLPLLNRLAPVWGLMDLPDDRKQHREATPLVGGIAIFIAVSAALLVLESTHSLLWCLAAMFLIGLSDDRQGLAYRVRFLGHLLVGLALFYLTGVGLHSLGDLLGAGPIQFDVMAWVLTAFAVASAVNSFNLIDGLDGLASGVAWVSFLLIAGLSFYSGQAHQALLAMILAAATLGFMFFNFPGLRGSRQRCFLGDSGSNLLGLVVVFLLVDLSQKGVIYPITALYIFAWPLMDTAAVIVRRRLSGRSPADAGNDHIHHILLAAGYGRTATVLLIQLATVLFAILGILLMKFDEPVSFAVYLLVLLGYLISTRNPERAARFLRVRRNRDV